MTHFYLAYKIVKIFMASNRLYNCDHQLYSSFSCHLMGETRCVLKNHAFDGLFDDFSKKNKPNKMKSTLFWFKNKKSKDQKCSRATEINCWKRSKNWILSTFWSSTVCCYNERPRKTLTETIEKRWICIRWHKYSSNWG